MRIWDKGVSLCMTIISLSIPSKHLLQYVVCMENNRVGLFDIGPDTCRSQFYRHSQRLEGYVKIVACRWNA